MLTLHCKHCTPLQVPPLLQTRLPSSHSHTCKMAAAGTAPAPTLDPTASLQAGSYILRRRGGEADGPGGPGSAPSPAERAERAEQMCLVQERVPASPGLGWGHCTSASPKPQAPTRLPAQAFDPTKPSAPWVRAAAWGGVRRSLGKCPCSRERGRASGSRGGDVAPAPAGPMTWHSLSPLPLPALRPRPPPPERPAHCGPPPPGAVPAPTGARGLCLGLGES